MLRTLLLIRHCQATGQAPDAPLTPAGQQQARHLAEFLMDESVDRIISSPYLRAVDTIKPFATCRGLAVDTDDRLSERVLSTAMRDDWRERLRDSFENLDTRLPGGESSREAMDRGRGVVDTVLAGTAACTVLVTHGNLMTLLLKSFDSKYGFSTWAELRNPDVYRVQLQDGQVRVEMLDLRTAGMHEASAH